MSRIQTELSISDLITTIKVLNPDDACLEYIATMLGFQLENQENTSMPPYPDMNEFGSQKMSIEQKPETEASSTIKTKKDKEIENEFTMEMKEEHFPILVQAAEIPKPLKYFSEKYEPLPEHLPLLNPIWKRTIITKMLSTDAYEGVPDLSTLIDIISHNLPFKQIPRKLSPSLCRGVQLLIDVGPGLVPYSRDQVYFLEELKNIIGFDAVEAWTFKGTPLMHSLSLSEPSLSIYRLPPAGTPILMLTDLGIAAPLKLTGIASIDQWRAFFQMANEARCPLLALVPYKSSRWPNSLKNLLTIIQWDRKTTNSNIMRMLL